MAGCCDNFSMIDGDSSNFSMNDGGDKFVAFPGLKGEDGTTFYPHVSAEGIISWTNDGGKPNPDPVNIKGADGKSAYQAAVEAGFSGTESEFNEYLSNIGVLTDEVSQQKSAIEDLQDLTNRKAGALIDTASGAIASFVPDSTIDNLLGVTVDVEPVQDLHGYDSPWPGGGGKNLLKTTLSSGTVNNVQITVNDDGTFTLNGNASSYAYLTVGKLNVDSSKSYYISPTLQLSSKYYYRILEDDFAVYGTERIYTPSQTREVTLQFVFPSNASFTNLLQKPMIRLSTISDATFAPYENLCPISGWSEVGIERTGFNVWDEETVGGWISTTGSIRSSTGAWVSKNYISVKPSAIYYSVNPNTGTAIRKVEYDANKNLIEGSVDWMVGQYTPSANARYIKIAQYLPQYGHDVSINYPSTDHNYHPYTGNTYTITLGQTVYGCKLTIAEDGSVTALVDRVCKTLSTARNLSSAYPGSIIYNRYSEETSDADFTKPFSCNRLKYVGDNPASTGWKYGACINATQCSFNLWISDTAFASLADATTFLANNETQICYYLATPVEIQIDPVTISTISGQTNNVWADAGDVDVTYAADIKWYIDKLNQPIEEDMIANTLIASGKYFTVNNRLFLSTASIAAGAQIIPGHNCTETSLVEALNALNA